MELIHRGKVKSLYATENPQEVRIHFEDDITAGDGEKRATIRNKGKINNEISTILFKLLEEKGIPTHFIKKLSDNDMLVKKVDIIPMEVVVRNIIAGSLAKRLGKEEGEKLTRPILEFYYKNDELHDPMINRYHALALGLATEEQLEKITDYAFKVNDILKSYLKEKGIDLVDFKLEFGVAEGKILLADEISPDSCRFWDAETHEKLDKDRFRRDIGNVVESYEEILRRIST